MGGWGRPHRQTVPRLLGMHRSQGTPLHPRAACQLRLPVLQRVPWLALARGMALGQSPAALPAATSSDADARQSDLPTMAACLGTGALAGKMRTTPRASPPPAALAAPLAIAVRDVLGIETAGRDVERVTQCAPTSLPSHAVDKTMQTAAAAPATRVGAAVCADGCGETHVRTFVPAAILAATPPAVANPYILAATAPAIANPYQNATTGTAAHAGGGEAAH